MAKGQIKKIAKKVLMERKQKSKISFEENLSFPFRTD